MGFLNVEKHPCYGAGFCPIREEVDKLADAVQKVIEVFA
jgi:hypothetical protein